MHLTNPWWLALFSCLTSVTIGQPRSASSVPVRMQAPAPHVEPIVT